MRLVQLLDLAQVENQLVQAVLDGHRRVAHVVDDHVQEQLRVFELALQLLVLGDEIELLHSMQVRNNVFLKELVKLLVVDDASAVLSFALRQVLGVIVLASFLVGLRPRSLERMR